MIGRPDAEPRTRLVRFDGGFGMIFPLAKRYGKCSVVLRLL
jgi:hypothetical protein